MKAKYLRSTKITMWPRNPKGKEIAMKRSKDNQVWNGRVSKEDITDAPGPLRLRV